MTTKSKPATPPDSLTNFDVLPNIAFVRLPTVCAVYGIAPATVWRRVKAGLMPAPKKIGDRLSGWQVGEIRADLAAIQSQE